MALPDPTTRPTLTVSETAELLRISRASAYEAVHAGTIPSLRIGRRLVVPTAALRRMLSIDGLFESEGMGGVPGPVTA